LVRFDGSIRDLEVESGRIDKKSEKEKTQCDLADPVRPGQKFDCSPLTFFLLKRYRFDFFKKNSPGQPDENLNPEP